MNRPAGLPPTGRFATVRAVSANGAPAGWYDDPGGSGGMRYWTGRTWSDEVRGAPDGAARPPTDERRLPDGYMMLNGRRLPLGTRQADVVADQRRGWVLVALVLTGICALLLLGLLQAVEGSADSEPAPAVTCSYLEELGDEHEFDC